MDGRAAPEARDLRAVAPAVLTHRIVPNYRATGEGLTAGKIIATHLEESA